MPRTHCDTLGRRKAGHASASSITSSNVSQQYHAPLGLHLSGLERVPASGVVGDKLKAKIVLDCMMSHGKSSWVTFGEGE